MKWGKRLIAWLICAAILLLPTSISIHNHLIGSPEIDVWNHAWGYWFVYQSLSEGILPLEINGKEVMSFEIGNAYKEILNEQFMREFLHHMVDTFDEDQLRNLYKHCVDQVYQEAIND